MQQCLTKHVARIWLFVQPDESWQSVKSSFEASLNDKRVNTFIFTGLCYSSRFVKILVAYSGIMEIFLLNLVMKEEKTITLYFRPQKLLKPNFTPMYIHDTVNITSVSFSNTLHKVQMLIDFQHDAICWIIMSMTQLRLKKDGEKMTEWMGVYFGNHRLVIFQAFIRNSKIFQWTSLQYLQWKLYYWVNFWKNTICKNDLIDF